MDAFERNRRRLEENQRRLDALRMQNNKPASTERPKQSFFNKVRDQFDANTASDQYRRQQAGDARLYSRQQKDRGIGRVANNPWERTLNLGKSIGESVYATPKRLGQAVEEVVNGNKTQQSFNQLNQTNQKVLNKVNARLANPNLTPAERSIQEDIRQKMIRLQRQGYDDQRKEFGVAADKLDPKKNAAAVADAALTIASAGVAGVAMKTAGQTAAKLGYRAAARQAAPAFFKNMGLNTAQGVTDTVANIGEGRQAGWKDIAKGGVVGATVGSVADVGLGLIPGVIGKRQYDKLLKDLASETDAGIVKQTVAAVNKNLPDEAVDNLSNDIAKAGTPDEVNKLLNEAADAEASVATKAVGNTVDNPTAPKPETPAIPNTAVTPEIVQGFKQAKTPQQARDAVKALFPELDETTANKVIQDLAQAKDDKTITQILEQAQTRRTQATQGVQDVTPQAEAIAPTPEQQIAEVAQNQPTAQLTSQQAPDADIQANKVVQRLDETGQPVKSVQDAVAPSDAEIVNPEAPDFLQVRKGDLPPTTATSLTPEDLAAIQPKERINPTDATSQAPVRSLKEKPAKQTFEQVTREYQGQTGAARVDRQATIADLQKRYKLSDGEKINAILAIDSPSVKPASPQVAQLVQEYKQLTDNAYRTYTDAGIKMGFVDSYLPRIYKNPETGQMIDRAEYELLQQGTSRVKGREADKVAVDWLVDKDPTKLLDRYYDNMDRTVAGRSYLKKLEDNGLVVASSDSVPGLRPIVAEGLQAGDGMIYYAQKDVANKLNNLFGSNEASNIVESALEKAQGVNSLFQSVVLSGGIPNTPLNAFGVMQVLKEAMALHPVKAGKGILAGLSKGFANDLFTKKKDILKLMAQNDIDVRVDLTQTGKAGRTRTVDAFKDQGVGGGINQAWNEFTNDSTFGRFMPALEVLHFENIYKSARGRGASIADASALAAESTKNFYGKTSVFKQAVRSKAVDDAAGAFLFAPRFRESMLNFWGKNAQAAIPTNWGKVAYRDNQKFMAAAAATFAAMTSLNEAMNGVQMWDNPDGKKDKLIIPAAALERMGIQTDGKDVAIPFLPSLSTVPRNLGMGAYNFATGNDEEGWKNVKSFASIPISLGMDVATNEDYFGSKIVEDGTPALDKRVQQGAYLVKNAMQPWIREGLNAAGQKLPESVKGKLGIKEKSAVEATSNTLELPFRFYNPKYYNYDKQFVPGGKEGEKFTFAEQRDRAKIGKEIKSIPGDLGLNKRQKAAYEKLNAVEFNDDGTLKEDSNPFYKVQRYSDLQDDTVFEAIKKRASLNAKLNGKPIDPIFDGSVTPEQRRVLLWKKTLPPGTSDPTVKKLYEQDWYQDYQNKESAYYDKKKVWNKEMGYKEPPQSTNPYPEASPELQKSMDFYFTLPKGTGARSNWIKSNGDTWNKMIGYWESKDAWTNGERAKVGLGNVDDEESGSANGKFGYNKKGGSGRGKGQIKKEATPKTYIGQLLGDVPSVSSNEINIKTTPKRAKLKVKTPSGKGRNYKKIKLG